MSLSIYGSYLENSEIIIFSLWTGVPALLLIETVKQIAYMGAYREIWKGIGTRQPQRIFSVTFQFSSILVFILHFTLMVKLSVKILVLRY